MAGGVGALGFGGGFGKALAAVLAHDRQTKREDEKLAEQRTFQGHMAALPIYLQHAQETGDYSVVENVLEQINPDVVKMFKQKGGSPFQVLGPLLANPELMGKSTAALPEGATSPDLEQEPPAPLVPTRVAGVPPPAPKTFLGMPVLTPEQKQERADQASDPATRMRLAQRYAKETGTPLEEAMDRFGLREYTGSASTIRYGGTVSGADLPDGTLDSFGRPKGNDTFYRVENLPNGTKQYVPTTTPGLVSAGSEFERAAQVFGYRRFADVPPEKRAEVEAKAKELSAELAKGTSQARTEGAGQGKMNNPADLKTAQDTGVPVGTTANQVAGQVVPTQAQQESNRGLMLIKADLLRILGDEKTKGLLGALPSKNELIAGQLPGAALALRRRSNEYREQIAQLESVVDSVVNVLARVRGQQKGAQTEKDAERAYNAVVKLQAGLFDPAGGDTQESAAARIQEALAGLDRVLSLAPKAPVPGAKPQAAAPSGGSGASTVPLPEGFEMRDGKIVIKTPPKK